MRRSITVALFVVLGFSGQSRAEDLPANVKAWLAAMDTQRKTIAAMFNGRYLVTQNATTKIK